MYAESEEEQRRYAELYAQQQFELTVRALQFEHKYSEAYKRLFPEAQVIDSKKMEGYYAGNGGGFSKQKLPEFLKAIQQNDRLMYFPEKSCRKCKSELMHLESMLTRYPGLRIDIYLRGINSAEDARRWAKSHDIDINFVHQGMLTINVDSGNFTSLSKQSNSSTPYYLYRGDQVFAINPKDIMAL